MNIYRNTGGLQLRITVSGLVTRDWIYEDPTLRLDRIVYSVSPGESIDLTILGLSKVKYVQKDAVKKLRKRFNDRKKKVNKK